MMAAVGSLQFSHDLGMCKNHGSNKEFRSVTGSGKFRLLGTNLSSFALRQDSWSVHLSKREHKPINSIPYRDNLLKCHSVLNSDQSFGVSCVKNAAFTLQRVCCRLQGNPIVFKLVPAVSIAVFAVWGLGPLLRQFRNIFLHKNDSNWRKSSTYYVMTSYLRPLLLWTGAILICRSLDPVVLPSEASQIVKLRLLNFVKSLSTVLAFAYCLSSVIQQAQRFFMETNDPTNTRNMGFQFAGKAVYTAVWVAAVSLFMELLGFSTQKWLTAGGLGTVLLTLAGREIFTNFLSSAMIHATRPFVVNEWIQTKIEGYEVSGTVEHVGWWSPTIVRGEDREAVHIPNHKFTVNVVRNLTQKTHWRIKTHLAINHLDVNKINNIVADMRKVLAKSPQVEQQKLHRRVFLDNIDPENQALMILISCFVKTSHFEEYLCVKEAVLLDLLRVIRHHRARLATPIRTVQKIYSDLDLENIPFSDSVITHGSTTSNRPLLIEPSYKINGEERTKTQPRSTRTNGGQDSKAAVRPTPDKADTKGGTTVTSPSKAKETSSNVKAEGMPISDKKTDAKGGEMPNLDTKDEHKAAVTSPSDARLGDQQTVKSTSKSVTESCSKSPEVSNSGSRRLHPLPDKPTQTVSNKQSKKTGEGTALQGSIDENIVLGVALDGSKRTLPIEEEVVSPPTPVEEKELATLRSGNVSPAVEKDKKNGQNVNTPTSTSSDRGVQ